jgi:hypothetical protein
MSHHQANLEPLNIFEFLLKVLFVSKAADPCVNSGWPSVLVQLSLPAGANNLPVETCCNNHSEKQLFVVFVVLIEN